MAKTLWNSGIATHFITRIKNIGNDVMASFVDKKNELLQEFDEYYKQSLQGGDIYQKMFAVMAKHILRNLEENNTNDVYEAFNRNNIEFQQMVNYLMVNFHGKNIELHNFNFYGFDDMMEYHRTNPFKFCIWQSDEFRLILKTNSRTSRTIDNTKELVEHDSLDGYFIANPDETSPVVCCYNISTHKFSTIGSDGYPSMREINAAACELDKVRLRGPNGDGHNIIFIDGNEMWTTNGVPLHQCFYLSKCRHNFIRDLDNFFQVGLDCIIRVLYENIAHNRFKDIMMTGMIRAGQLSHVIGILKNITDLTHRYCKKLDKVYVTIKFGREIPPSGPIITFNKSRLEIKGYRDDYSYSYVDRFPDNIFNEMIC